MLKPLIASARADREKLRGHTAPGIVVDCIEMDSVLQENALLEGRISVGILVPSDRPDRPTKMTRKNPIVPTRSVIHTASFSRALRRRGLASNNRATEVAVF